MEQESKVEGTSSGTSALSAGLGSFDAWLANPYTKTLMESVKTDYVPKAENEALRRQVETWSIRAEAHKQACIAAELALAAMTAERDGLRQVCRNVYEVWAGSEGIPKPETCAEAYLLRLVEQMRDAAKEGLK